MAYSNTNRDKVQANTDKKVKTAILTVILAALAISSWTNIVQQITTINDAKQRNQEIELKIEKLKIENSDLSRRAESASTSAILNREIREYLGLGTDKDHWIVANLEPDNNLPENKITVVENKANILQWWDLFTK